MVLGCQWTGFPVHLIRKLIIIVRSLILIIFVIDSRWDSFTVDCFASYANTKILTVPEVHLKRKNQLNFSIVFV